MAKNYRGYTIGKQAYGSHRYYAVLNGDLEPFNAAWLPNGIDQIQTMDGPVRTDGLVRFFGRQRDVVACIDRKLGAPPTTKWGSGIPALRKAAGL